VVKNKFRHFLATLEKLVEESTSAPPGIYLSDAHAHKHVKLHHFCKKVCCFTPSGIIVQQHQGDKQAIAV